MKNQKIFDPIQNFHQTYAKLTPNLHSLLKTVVKVIKHQTLHRKFGASPV